MDRSFIKTVLVKLTDNVMAELTVKPGDVWGGPITVVTAKGKFFHPPASRGAGCPCPLGRFAAVGWLGVVR